MQSKKQSIMRKAIFIVFIIVFPFFSIGQDFTIDIDLSKVKKDKVKIKTLVEKVNCDSILYVFPAAIPGDYELYNFGKYISKFRVYDSIGNDLAVHKNDTNSYWIYNNGQNFSIEYFALENNRDRNNIFYPSSTQFNKGKFYLLNLFTLIGYTNTEEEKQFALAITRPKKFSPITTLNFNSSRSKGLFKVTDRYFSKSYIDLVDNPIVYYKTPDTTNFKINNSSITISNYKPRYQNTKYSSIDFKNDFSKLLIQYKEFFGPIPVDNYLFSIVEYGKATCKTSSYYGALEHKNNTLIYLNSYFSKAVISTSKTVAAHEFMHLIAPLDLCSKERLDYDYLNPPKTRHIWLYEGVTEYLALKLLISSGISNCKGLVNTLRTKLSNSAIYPGYSLTELSYNIYNEPYKHFYSHFYDLGALTCLAFDIKLIESTNGEYDLVKLINELKDEYGQGVGFYDDQLFEIIVRKTNDEIFSFITKHIKKYTPMNYKSIFNIIGLEYKEMDTIDYYKFNFRVIKKGNKLYLYNFDGKAVLPADKIKVLINNSKIEEYFQKLTFPINNNSYDLMVRFNGKKQTLKVSPEKHSRNVKHYIDFIDNPTRKQKEMFKKVFCVKYPKK